MIKIIMKRVPKKIDKSVQHQVMKNWSAAMVEMHRPKQSIKVISGKELAQKNEQISTSEK